MEKVLMKACCMVAGLLLSADAIAQDNKGIEYEFHYSDHGHEWQFWREQLRDFASEIFREK